jgi:endonuclease/exonuclease/phosphatase family metal-dependent hydrolase
MRLRALFGTAAAALLLLTAGATGAGADRPHRTQARAGAEVRVITHNICGPSCDNDGRVDAAAYTVEEIQRWDPHIVMLQEVCRQQFDWTAARLTGYTVEYVPMLDSHPGCGGQATGQLLAVKGGAANKEVIDLGANDYDADGKVYRALCLDATIAGLGTDKVKSCVLHIRAFHDANKQWNFRARWAQLGTLAAELDDDLLADDQVVILGGDFNARAHEHAMDPLYQLTQAGTPGTFGMFAEADQTDKTYFTGDCTTACRTGGNTMADRKYDFIFFSARHASGLSGGILDYGGSDHKLYRGRAVITP